VLAAVRGDPQYFPERLALLAVQHLGPASAEWAREAARVGTRASVDARLLSDTENLARVNGAVAGTPFLLALVPAYVIVLWEQARMVLRMAALNDRDPTNPRMAAEFLTLRGLYPNADAATEALASLGASRAGRRSPRTWMRLAYRVLIVAGFVSAGEPHQPPSRRRRALLVVGGGVAWILTWVFPLTFMVMMSWSCGSDTRALGRRAIVFYESAGNQAPELARRRRGHTRRDVFGVVLLALSIGVPLGVVALAVSTKTRGLGWLAILAPLMGLALVLALSARVRRRAPTA
jgi:hypothetical protein